MGSERIERAEQGGASNSGASPLPENLRTNMESMSGVDLSGVDVHYRSPRPAEIGALAFAQGSTIHVAPGQEQHLPHEAWHVVQQAQGRVAPMTRMNRESALNTDSALEREAEVMGQRATRIQRATVGGHPAPTLQPVAASRVVQRMVTAKKANLANLTELNAHLKALQSKVVIGASDFEDESPTAAAIDKAIAASSMTVTKALTKKAIVSEINTRLANQVAQAKKPQPKGPSPRILAAQACPTINGAKGQYYGGGDNELHVHDVGGAAHLKGPGGARKNFISDSKLRAGSLREARLMLVGHAHADILNAAIDKALLAYGYPLDNY